VTFITLADVITRWTAGHYYPITLPRFNIPSRDVAGEALADLMRIGREARQVMTTTGPLPAVGEQSTSTERVAALVMMGSPFSRGIWRTYPTADAVIDTDRGILFMAVDMDVDPGDWAAMVGLIHAVGWDNGTWPHSDDPGVPDFDNLSGVWCWRLEYVR
jgi:hypothetical protein